MESSEIIDSIRSGVTGIHIQGQDLVRIDEEIVAIATQLKLKVTEWNWGYGWVDFESKRPFNLDKGASLYDDLQRVADDDPSNRLYIIKNADSALKSDLRSVARLQQELLRMKRYFCGKSAIILVSQDKLDFTDLSNLIVAFQCLPLAYGHAEKIIQTFLDKYAIIVSTEVKNSLSSICSGMERETIYRVLQTLHNRFAKKFPEEATEIALTLKKGILSQSGLLELIDPKVNISQIGGLEQLKNWLRNKKYIIDDLAGAEKFGIAAPKGVLLAGMPGCGKSMSAKATASLFKVPLLRLDIGSLMGKFVGESESNMKAALRVAEKASPCVLWIDELEKAFSGVNGAGGSTEITTRLFGYFLTWMQEKPSAVFVIATANDITTIPPELLRRGRFDEIFYIDLPCVSERKQIFKVLTDQLSPRPTNLNLDDLAEKTEGFSGADIGSVINDSLESLFRSHQTILNQDMLNKHIKLVTPISVVLEKKIKHYRELFSEFRLKSASLSEEERRKLESSSTSSDVSERENAASNEFLSPKNLLVLSKDNSPSVRRAVLGNPSCPIEVLKQLVDNYQAFDFSKSASWSESEISKEEFNLALQHPNMSGSLLVDLYKTKKKIAPDELLRLVNKLSQHEQEIVFDIANVKLPRSIQSGVVRKICIAPSNIVKPQDTLLELDDENGNTQRITTLSLGCVLKICTSLGARINAGDSLVKILVAKKF